MKLVIVDYGAGNLRSVARAVAHVGGQPLITANPRDVDDAKGRENRDETAIPTRLE